MGSSGAIVLREHAHDENFLCVQSNCCVQTSVLRAMQADDKWCDVSLFGAPPPGVGAGKVRPIRAHIAVLAKASPRFSDLFTDSSKAVYHISFVDHEILRLVVNFVYTDKLPINKRNAVSALRGVLLGAKYLLMSDLADACETFLADKIDLNNCVFLLCLAREYNCATLMHATLTFIAENLAHMPKNDEFLSMRYNDCAKLLSSKAYITADADDRYVAAIAWLNYNAFGSRGLHVRDVLNMVPLTPDSVSTRKVREANKSRVLWEHAPDAVRNLTSGLLERLTTTTTTTSGCCSGGSYYPKWYVVGESYDGPGTLLMYDASRRLWSKLSDVPWERQGAGVTVTGNRLTVLGGRKNGFLSDDIDEYDLSTGRWTNISTKLSVARGYLTTACRVGQQQQTLVIGGVADEPYRNVDMVEQYDAESKRIMSVAPMRSKRSCFASASNRASVFVAGGHGDDDYCGSIEKYDVCTNTWTDVGQIKWQDTRWCLAGAISGDDLYLAGGACDDTGTPVNMMQKFNVVTGQISAAPNLPHARSEAHATTLYDGSVVCVVGGESLNVESAREVLCLDTRQGKWSTSNIVPDMPEAAAGYLGGFAVLG